jgi:hypothetical protein
MRKVSLEAQEFFDNILSGDEPVFVSDEATIWDVSTSTADELLERCSKFYGLSLTSEDLKQPLWKLLRKLNDGRKKTGNYAG